MNKSFLGSAAVLSIDFYQQHLSKRKGFACAYRVLHGDRSCSHIIKEIVQRDGLDWEQIRVQFADCKAAAAQLRYIDEDDRKKRRRRRNGDSLDWCYFGSVDVCDCFSPSLFSWLPGCDGATDVDFCSSN